MVDSALHVAHLLHAAAVVSVNVCPSTHGAHVFAEVTGSPKPFWQVQTLSLVGVHTPSGVCSVPVPHEEHAVHVVSSSRLF